MKAFVKVNNGTFPNLNFYLAWEALTFMGYDVTLFEEKNIDNLDITPATPVFAGVKIFRQVIDKLGVDYPPFDCYPDVLKPYYGRNIRKSTLGEERRKFDKNPIPVFVKPVLPKQFIGQVWRSILQLIPLANIPDSAEVYVCEPIEILSEFRVYVHDGDILGVKHYYGDWEIVPNKKLIELVVKNYKPCPISYGIDFGTTEKDTFVLEVNDGCNLGNYGLDYIHYGEMMVSRWFEIMGKSKSEELGKQLAKDIHTRLKLSEREKYAAEVHTRLNYDIGIPEVNLELKNPPIVAGHRRLKCNWAVRVDKHHVSDPYQRHGILPSGFFETGAEVKKFIEEKVEKYKYTEYYLIFKVDRFIDYEKERT